MISHCHLLSYDLFTSVKSHEDGTDGNAAIINQIIIIIIGTITNVTMICYLSDVTVHERRILVLLLKSS